MRVVELAGGVGGAKLAHGLQAVVGADLAVVVNTADDCERHGLAIWPDHDTVMYTLAELDARTRGWGLAGETWTVMDRLAALGGRLEVKSAPGRGTTITAQLPCATAPGWWSSRTRPTTRPAT